MKMIPLLVIALSLTCSFYAQNSTHSTFWHQRASLFEKLPASNEDILFVGNSISNGGEWAELFNDQRVKNRGISGDICMGVYDRLQPMLNGKPAKIFLMIGINDLGRGTSPDTIVCQMDRLLEKIQKESPETTIYLQSILPVNESFGMFEGHTRHREIIAPLNQRLGRLAKKRKITYIDLYSSFVTPGTNKLDPAYSNDGLHLMGAGYIKWAELVKPYIDE